LAEQKAVWAMAQADIEALARAVEELKKMVDKFTARVPSLEDHVKHLENKVIDSLTEIQAREL
jgi:peptidoglycan hydrolase CwlO-like protein